MVAFVAARPAVRLPIVELGLALSQDIVHMVGLYDRRISEASCLPKEDGSSTFAAWLTPRFIGLSPDDQSSWCDDWFGVETASRITRPVGNPNRATRTGV